MIQTKNLYKVYKRRFSKLTVLEKVDLKVKAGDSLCIVGPSGAGKSTLLHILAGLDLPTKGEVLIGGRDIYSLSYDKLAAFRNKKIGFVFQFYHLFGEFSALENIMLPAIINSRADVRQAQRKAKTLLNMLGLSKRADHKPRELSGGEQQRVVIGRALINDPEILFCDEPTGNLDSDTGEQIMSILFNLKKERQMTQVLVTHNERLAQSCQKRVYLKDGKIKKNQKEE